MTLTLASNFTDLFVVGTVGFYFIAAVFAIWMIAATSYENNAAASSSIFFFLVYLQLIGVDILGSLIKNPFYFILGAIVLWLFVGVVYSFIKWRRLLTFYVRQYDYFFAKFTAAKGLPDGIKELPTQALKKEWVDWVNGNNYYFDAWAKGPVYGSSYQTKMNGPIYEEPDASKHRFQIIHWIAYWPINAPISGAVFLCEDVFVEFANWTYHYLGDMYQSVARSVFRSRNVNANLPDDVVAKKLKTVKK